MSENAAPSSADIDSALCLQTSRSLHRFGPSTKGGKLGPPKWVGGHPKPFPFQQPLTFEVRGEELFGLGFSYLPVPPATITKTG
jgi:hypothetical protein